MRVQEALSRFFPGFGNDNRERAERLLKWLDTCGYRVVPKNSQNSNDVEPPTEH